MFDSHLEKIHIFPFFFIIAFSILVRVDLRFFLYKKIEIVTIKKLWRPRIY